MLAAEVLTRIASVAPPEKKRRKHLLQGICRCLRTTLALHSIRRSSQEMKLLACGSYHVQL